MKYFNPSLLLTLIIIVVLFACSRGKDNLEANPEDQITSKRTQNLIAPTGFTFNDTKYPAGTEISFDDGSIATFLLPSGFEFVYYQTEVGQVYRTQSSCYECTCSVVGVGGCDPEWNGGFGCYHADDCTGKCTGEHVDCDDDSAVSFITIYNYPSGINFIQTEENYDSLNQFKYSLEAILIEHVSTLDLITDVLFKNSYQIDTTTSTELIPITYYGNLTAIIVKSSWREHTITSFDSLVYAVGSTGITCTCTFANPFDVRPGDCIPNYFEGLGCVNECVESCRMKLDVTK